VAALLALHATDARSVEAVLDEQWFVVRIGGAVVGTATERYQGGQEGVSYQAHMNIRFSRLGTPISMMMFTEEMTDAQGAFRRARVESSLSNFTATAVLDGDSLRYESNVGGATVDKVFAWDPNACSEVLASERVRAWLTGAAPETTVVLFDVSDGSFRRARMVRGERTGEGGDRVTAVDEYDEGADTPTSTTWYDYAGDATRTVVRQLGIVIEVARVSQVELATVEIEPDFDIIRQSMIPCGNFPTPVSRVDRVALRLDFPGAPPMAPMNGPNQKELGRDARSVVLELSRDSSNRERIEAAALADFLEPDRFVQSDHPEIRAVADSIRAAAHVNGWPLARAIAQWVNADIVNKGMEHGYASAPNTRCSPSLCFARPTSRPAPWWGSRSASPSAPSWVTCGWKRTSTAGVHSTPSTCASIRFACACTHPLRASRWANAI
jgi:hypothetical protein